MKTPDPASITNKGWTGGCSLREEPSGLSHEADMGSCVLCLLPPGPLVWQEAHAHGKKEGPVIDILIIPISEMGTPALTEVK